MRNGDNWWLVLWLVERSTLAWMATCVQKQRRRPGLGLTATMLSEAVELPSSTLEVVSPRMVSRGVSTSSWPSPVRGPYVDGEVVLASAIVDTEAKGPWRAYARAGPRRRVTLEGATATCAVVTCGGLCPGLNAVVQEVARCLQEQYGVQRVLGVEGGYAGLAGGRLTELEARSIYETGGTVLGTSRDRQDPATMARILEEHNVDALFVVGGDGTMRGASALCDALPSTSNLRVVCVPKTIDNDIPIIDRSFGFETSVAAAKQAIDAAVVEARSFPRGLGIVRLMGRDAGFLAAHAALACPGDVDAVLLPEKAFALEPLLDFLADRLDTNDAAVLVVAEGVNARLTQAPKDDRPLPDVGAWLCDQVKQFFVGEAKVSLKYVDPTYSVRAVPSNAADTILCARLAANAVHAA